MPLTVPFSAPSQLCVARSLPAGDAPPFSAAASSGGGGGGVITHGGGGGDADEQQHRTATLQVIDGGCAVTSRSHSFDSLLPPDPFMKGFSAIELRLNALFRYMTDSLSVISLYLCPSLSFS